MSNSEYNSIIWLTQGKYAIVDNAEYDRLNQWKWSYVCGYAIRIVRIDGKNIKIYMHRLINKTPLKMQTDHINRVRSDNRKNNLRTVTNQQNSLNKDKAKLSKRQSSSIYKGVCLRNSRSKKWQAQFAGIYLGIFDTEIEAAKAYNSKAQQMYGSQVTLNLIHN